jgi:hypothetical protein
MDSPHNHLFRSYVSYITHHEHGQLIGHAMVGAASFTIYTRTKEFCRDHQLVDYTQLLGSAAVGGLGGAMAGSLISFGSARESASCLLLYVIPLLRLQVAFELVKVPEYVTMS